MGKGRLEAFSDGVIAIIITIMVLEIHVPKGTDIESVISILPKLLVYLFSFIFLGIYWMNHHHLLNASKKINGKILWANLSLLFWLSLVPFAANWMGENLFQSIPTMAYGIILFMAGISYLILQNLLIAIDGKDSKIAIAIGNDWKGKLTQVLIFLGIIFSLIVTQVSCILYITITIIWFIPDKRIENMINKEQK